MAFITATAGWRGKVPGCHSSTTPRICSKSYWNTLKYLDQKPLVGVNPSPRRWDGVLLPFKVPDLRKVIPEVVHQRRAYKAVSMAVTQLKDGQQLYAVNDLFVGQRTHVSARYQVQIGGQSENQSSSRVIISTGLGYTGWFKSILAAPAAPNAP